MQRLSPKNLITGRRNNFIKCEISCAAMPLTYYLWASPDCVLAGCVGKIFCLPRSASPSDAGGPIFDFIWRTQF